MKNSLTRFYRNAKSDVGRVIAREKLDDDEKEEDEDSAIMEEEFGKYLQGWAEMLQEEIFQEYEDDDDDIEYVEINNITHPAIDSNAK